MQLRCDNENLWIAAVKSPEVPASPSTRYEVHAMPHSTPSLCQLSVDDQVRLA